MSMFLRLAFEAVKLQRQSLIHPLISSLLNTNPRVYSLYPSRVECTTTRKAHLFVKRYASACLSLAIVEIRLRVRPFVRSM